jgi:general secretion pathway protein F
VATVLALLTFFLPRVVALFRDYDRLPLPTRILIALSDFFAAWWYWLVIAALLAAAVLFRLASVPAGRQWLDSLKLRIPLMRRMLLYSDLSRYSRTLALLVDAGISIDRALALASSTVRNRVLRLQLEGARDSTIRQGRALSEGLRRAPDVPPFLVNLVAVGEEGGRLPEALTDVAVFYEKELDQQGRLVTSLLEPILILTVGALVGFIVAAMLLPIFELGTGLR